MALKNLFDMVKADKYTADGREELNKAREAETEDVKYEIGQISQKTGLQKTANGWVKPKNGKAPGAKTGEGPLYGKAESKPGRDYPALKKEDHVKLAKEVKSNTLPGGSDWTAEEIAKEWQLGKADAEEVKKEFDKLKESKPARNAETEAFYAEEAIEQNRSKREENDTERMQRRAEENYGDWSENELRAELASLKEKEKQGYNYSDDKDQIKWVLQRKGMESEDAAPRVLTGDTKIRVRKA